MGKFKEMDLLRQEREAFDADYPLPPPPHWGGLWVAWNSEDGFTFWEDEQQAVRWSAADSNEYPVQYVMQKAQTAPVHEPVAWETVYETIIHWDEGGGKRSRRELARRIVDLYTTPPAAQKPWVGLTDAEVAAAWPCELGSMEKRFARTIEAKLKEKNCG
jgi:hypothetical protein